MNLTINVEDVQSVYSGTPGCACGCRGKHTYASATKAAASMRGYAVDDDEVSDKTVRLITKKVIAMAALPESAVMVTPKFISVQTDARLYVLYFVTR